jgi:pre-mRNA-splicing factor ISY1
MIRDMNDKINKSLREKKHWETQIRALGGPDLSKGPRVTDSDGKAAMGADGYLYFGAAKDLPGVRELFERNISQAVKRTRGDLQKMVDADYYGYRDDDDGRLEALEKKQEKKAVVKAVEEWMAQATLEQQAEMARAVSEEGGDDDNVAIQRGVLTAYVALPSQAEIEKMIVQKKKQELIAKYSLKG